MSPNISKEKLREIVAVFPDNLKTSELYAIIRVLFEVYHMDRDQQVMIALEILASDGHSNRPIQ